MGLLAKIFGENYKYFDTPDGEDCFDKLFYVTKYAASYGVCISSVDVLLVSRPVGYTATLARYGYIMLPMVGVAAAWSGAICAATNIRKKNDHGNYAIGGLAAGALIGAWRQSVKVGSYSALGLAALSALYKDCLINDYPFFNKGIKPVHNNVWSVNRDLSITSDPPKTWTTKLQ